MTSNLDVSRLAPLLRILQSKFTITTLKIVELVGEKAASIIANTDLIQSLNNCALRHYFNCIDHLWREAYSYSTYLMIQTASIDHATCHKNFLQLPDYELFQTEIGVGSYCNPSSRRLPQDIFAPAPESGYFFYDRYCSQYQSVRPISIQI